jgi:hypothetical protein
MVCEKCLRELASKAKNNLSRRGKPEVLTVPDSPAGATRRGRGMNAKKGAGYVSTGQAAKMLGISTLTVQRYFDKDSFRWKKSNY